MPCITVIDFERVKFEIQYNIDILTVIFYGKAYSLSITFDIFSQM